MVGDRNKEAIVSSQSVRSQQNQTNQDHHLDFEDFAELQCTIWCDAHNVRP